MKTEAPPGLNVPQWTDALTLGYQPMDEVHEEFVAHIAALRASSGPRMLEAMREIGEHARDHFGTEDAWMQETQFPARECHVAEHAAVLRSIEGVTERVAQGDDEAGRRLAEALWDWFPPHADYLDSALAHWMCKRALGGRPVVLRRSITTGFVPADLNREGPLR